jgi:hypothetical protein
MVETYYVVTDVPRHLLCERVAKVGGGYQLYEYDPESGTYHDSGYARDLDDLRLKISLRYGWGRTGLFLARSFEEAARLFTSEPPRVIHVGRGTVFCAGTGDALFHVKWDYDADGNFFVKRFEWLLGGEEPRSLKDALERLNEYAEKRDVWILLRELIKQATAYVVHPCP